MFGLLVKFCVVIYVLTKSDQCHFALAINSNDYLYKNDEHFNEFFQNEGPKILCVLFGICSTVSTRPSHTEAPTLSLIQQWNMLDFDYPSETARKRDIDKGTFVPGVPAPIDVEVNYFSGSGKSVLVTIPRFQAGIPVTLGVVSNKFNGNSTLITPYPSWDWHTDPTSCKKDRLLSVYRVQIDPCGRLWVVDSGRFVDKLVCPPQIIAFDLATNRVVHRFELPQSLYEPRSYIVTPVVDVRDDRCENVFVYLADCQAYSIIVHDVKARTAWKATDKTMYPYPNFGTYSIQGDSFDLMDGVLGMSLSPYKPGQERILFYQAMSSGTQNWVKTSDLRNQTRFKDNPESSPEIFHTYQYARSTQSAAEAMDKSGIMYYGLMSDTTINCWNTQFDYNPSAIDIVASNSETLQFASGVKVKVNPKSQQELWVLTSRFQKIGAGTITAAEVNFRILAGRIDDLIFGKKCKRPKNTTGGYGLYKLK